MIFGYVNMNINMNSIHYLKSTHNFFTRESVTVRINEYTRWYLTVSLVLLRDVVIHVILKQQCNSLVSSEYLLYNYPIKVVRLSLA